MSCPQGYAESQTVKLVRYVFLADKIKLDFTVHMCFRNYDDLIKNYCLVRVSNDRCQRVLHHRINYFYSFFSYYLYGIRSCELIYQCATDTSRPGSSRIEL